MFNLPLIQLPPKFPFELETTLAKLYCKVVLPAYKEFTKHIVLPNNFLPFTKPYHPFFPCYSYSTLGAGPFSSPFLSGFSRDPPALDFFMSKFNSYNPLFFAFFPLQPISPGSLLLKIGFCAPPLRWDPEATFLPFLCFDPCRVLPSFFVLSLLFFFLHPRLTEPSLYFV